MKRPVKRIIIFFILILFLPAWADQLTPMDFAFGINLDVKEPGTVFKLQPPREMYQNLCRKDFGDIRIFNNQGKMVPHTLKRPEIESVERIKSEKLAFFPVFKSQLKNPNTLSLYVKTDNKGSIINFNTLEPVNTDKKLSFFLIDLTRLEQTPDQLEFNWGNDVTPFSVKTHLEFSNNLTDWNTINTDTALASLTFSNQSLVKNKISLPGKKIKYLRMTWPLLSDPTGEKIKEIHALFVNKEKKDRNHWYSIKPVNYDPDTLTLEYRIDGFFPLKWVNLELAGQNRTVKGILQSRPDTESEWKTRHRGLFYNISLDGMSFSNQPVRIENSKDPYWKFIIDKKQSQIDTPFPRLKLGWVPHDIYFLNQGHGPFTLVYGNYDIPVLENLIDPLLSNFDKNRQAEMIKTILPGKPYILAGKKVIKKPFPWQKYSLWTILVMGVAILGTMAVRLSRQINTEKNK